MEVTKSSTSPSANSAQEKKFVIRFPDKSTDPTPIDYKKFQKDTHTRLEKIDNLLMAVVGAVVISGIAVIIAVVAIFMDQFRFNNAAYKDYSSKTESLESQQKLNTEILNQNQDQEKLIEQQQAQIEQLLKTLPKQ